MIVTTRQFFDTGEFITVKIRASIIYKTLYLIAFVNNAEDIIILEFWRVRDRKIKVRKTIPIKEGWMNTVVFYILEEYV